MGFYKYPEAYVFKELISNYKQVAVADIVTATIPGWDSLQNKHNFWREAPLFNVLGAFTFGAATGFGALGSGFGGGLAVSSEAIAAAGPGAGAALGGGIGMADNALAATKIPTDKVLKSMGMIGQVINFDEKNSTEHHFQVRFCVPQEDETYVEKDV